MESSKKKVAMLRASFDNKPNKSSRLSETHVTKVTTELAPQTGDKDCFVSTARIENRFTSVVSARVREKPVKPEDWWCQALIDALPKIAFTAPVPELDERSKEALRALAQAAPHRTIED